MNIRDAAKVLGGEPYGRNALLCPGPGHSVKDRSLRVAFEDSAPDGFTVHSFCGDDWQTCKDHVRQMLGLGGFEPSPSSRAPVKTTKPAAYDSAALKARDYAGRAWTAARPIGGTIAEKYLQARGILIPDEIYSGQALRFHPECTFRLDNGEYVRVPAMVAAVVDIQTNEFLAIHRTALKSDGSGKLQMRGLPGDGRMMLGRSAGGCVKLSPDENVTSGLGIGEGLETSLAVMGNFGFRPMWAVLSTSGMKSFPVLSGIDFLTIWADSDVAKNGREAGLHAARECGARWAEAGREGEILTPPMLQPDKGTDWNDIAQGRAA